MDGDIYGMVFFFYILYIFLCLNVSVMEQLLKEASEGNASESMGCENWAASVV